MVSRFLCPPPDIPIQARRKGFLIIVAKAYRKHRRPMRISLQETSASLSCVVKIDTLVPRSHEEAERGGGELDGRNGIAGRGKQLILCL